MPTPADDCTPEQTAEALLHVAVQLGLRSAHDVAAFFLARANIARF
jgi:hypothetical protein